MPEEKGFRAKDAKEKGRREALGVVNVVPSARRFRGAAAMIYSRSDAEKKGFGASRREWLGSAPLRLCENRFILLRAFG
jgi:hypothetical protein